MRTIIQNGTIVSDTAAFRADLLLEDGVVKAVGAGLSAPDAQVIDASGKYVLPGAVDVHTHMDLQAGAHRAVDDFYTGTVAGRLRRHHHHRGSHGLRPQGLLPVAPGGGVPPSGRRKGGHRLRLPRRAPACG